MANTVNFPKGMYFNKPRKGAPDFVVGSISFKLEIFIPWLENMADQNWVDFQLTESVPNDRGQTRYSAQIDTYWKKEGRPTPKPPQNEDFVAGAFIYTPFENAPRFIIANMRVYVPYFKEYLINRQNDQGYVNLDVLMTKDKERFYLSLNTYVNAENMPPEGNKRSSYSKGKQQQYSAAPVSGDVDLDADYEDDDTPF